MKYNSESSKPKGHTRMQWAMAILANMTVFTYGLQIGWISPMRRVLQSNESPIGIQATEEHISWLASIVSLTAVPGVMMFLYIVDRYGRKPVIMLMCAMQTIAWLLKLFANSMTMLILARIIAGVAAGGCFHVIPMYVKEIAQDNIRGTLGSLLVIFQNTGILAIYALGGYLDYYTILWTVIGIPVFTFGLFLKAPESPCFLVKMGNIKEAAINVAFLRGLTTDEKHVIVEVDLMKNQDDYFRSLPPITYLSIFKEKAWRRSFMVMVLIVLPHATNGVFSVINFAEKLLATSGVTISPELQSLSVPIFMTLGSLITFTSVDKLGRKPILVVTFTITAIVFAYLASSILLTQHGWTTSGWLNVAAIAAAVCCYGAGVSPLPFIVMSEIFNFQIRAKLMAGLVITAWSMSFFQLMLFSYLSSNFGFHVAFYAFAVINLAGAAVAIFLMPETNKKSIEDIEAEMRGDKIKDRKKQAEFNSC